MEIERLKTALEKVEDPRRTDRGHVLHKLEDILIIGLCTLVCNGSDFSDMEDFGREREEWLTPLPLTEKRLALLHNETRKLLAEAYEQARNA